MQLFRIYAVGLPLFLTLYAALALPGRNPLLVLGSAVRGALTAPGLRLTLVGALVLAAAALQAGIDPAVSAWLGYDLTGWVASIEGELVVRVQETLPDWAVGAVSLFYLPGYVGYLALPPIVWCALRAEPLITSPNTDGATSGYAAGFALNFALALPFYFFFPVQEVAWSGLSAAEPLMERVFPGISDAVRVGSALDNCFPSLHVSCTVTALWFARRFGPRSFARLAWALTVGTAWTVMALGIHWGLDVVTGVAHGLVCAHLGLRLGPALERRFSGAPTPPPAATRR